MLGLLSRHFGLFQDPLEIVLGAEPATSPALGRCERCRHGVVRGHGLGRFRWRAFFPVGLLVELLHVETPGSVALGVLSPQTFVPFLFRPLFLLGELRQVDLVAPEGFHILDDSLNALGRPLRRRGEVRKVLGGRRCPSFWDVDDVVTWADDLVCRLRGV